MQIHSYSQYLSIDLVMGDSKRGDDKFQIIQDGYEVTMLLQNTQGKSQRPRDDPCLVLKLMLKKETMQEFEGVVDSLYIMNQKNLSTFVKTPQQLLDYFRRSFKTKAHINQKGQIMFRIDVECLNTDFSFKIQTIPVTCSSVDIQMRRISKLEMQLKKEKATGQQRDQEIKSLRHQLAELKQEQKEQAQNLQKSLKQIKSLWGHNDELVQLLLWRGIITGQPFDSNDIKENCKGHFANKYTRQVASYARVHSLLENPHNCCFLSQIKSEHGKVKNTIKKVSTNSWRTFLCAKPVEHGSTYHIQLNKLTQNRLCVGVGNHKMIGSGNATISDYSHYAFHSNSVCEDKIKRQQNNQINSKSHLEVFVDLEKYQVEILGDGLKICQIIIPPFMRMQVLYFILHFHNENDSMTLWVE